MHVRVCILCIVMFLKCQHKFNYQMCRDIFVVIIINIDDHSHYRQVFWSKHFQILYYDQVVIWSDAWIPFTKPEWGLWSIPWFNRLMIRFQESSYRIHPNPSVWLNTFGLSISHTETFRRWRRNRGTSTLILAKVKVWELNFKYCHRLAIIEIQMRNAYTFEM